MGRQHLAIAEEGRKEAVFEADVVGAQAPSEILDVDGVAQREDSPDQRIIESKQSANLSKGQL